LKYKQKGKGKHTAGMQEWHNSASKRSIMDNGLDSKQSETEASQTNIYSDRKSGGKSPY